MGLKSVNMLDMTLLKTCLNSLCGLHLLIRQEKGFYCFQNRKIAEVLYRIVPKSTVENYHGIIADYLVENCRGYFRAIAMLHYRRGPPDKKHKALECGLSAARDALYGDNPSLFLNYLISLECVMENSTHIPPVNKLVYEARERWATRLANDKGLEEQLGVVTSRL